ncbi:uncharacterized protein LOC102809556 [Saccoglossus kowalevskii]
MRKMRDLQDELERLRREMNKKPEAPQVEMAPMFPMPYAGYGQRPPSPPPQPYPPPQMPVAYPPPLSPRQPGAGFLVFFDFIIGLDPSSKILRLITAQWEKENELGDPTTFPVTYCNPAQQQPGGYGGFGGATIATRQQVPNAKPEPTTAVVCEVQLSSQPHDSKSLVSRAWAKLPLFDEQVRLLTGRWKAPLRITPVRPEISFNELATIPQLGGAELYYRVVDWRDAPREGGLPVSMGYAQHYTFAPQPGTSYGGGPYGGAYQGGGGVYAGGGGGGSRGGGPYGGSAQPYASPYAGGGGVYGGGGGVPPPPPSPPPREELLLPIKSTKRYHTPLRSKQISSRVHPAEPIIALPPKPVPVDVGTILGLQVDRVRNALDGEGKVRLTVYHQYTGQPANSGDTPITCTTTPVQSNFKYGYHVFGQQEAIFTDVSFQSDMILVARFYLRKRMKTDI